MRARRAAALGQMSSHAIVHDVGELRQRFRASRTRLWLPQACRSLSGAPIDEMLDAAITSGKNEPACSPEATEHLREPRVARAARAATGCS